MTDNWHEGNPFYDFIKTISDQPIEDAVTTDEDHGDELRKAYQYANDLEKFSDVLTEKQMAILRLTVKELTPLFQSQKYAFMPLHEQLAYAVGIALVMLVMIENGVFGDEDI